MANAPHTSEHIVLVDDEKKITFEMDKKIPDAGTFTIMKEDHTVGNMVRFSLLRDTRVVFAGYRMPHPLENKMHVKIRTRPAFRPVAVFNDSLTALTAEIGAIETQFKEQISAKRNPTELVL